MQLRSMSFIQRHFILVLAAPGLLLGAMIFVSDPFPSDNGFGDVPTILDFGVAPAGNSENSAQIASDDLGTEADVGPSIMFPVYNRDGLDALLADLRSSVQPGDEIVIVTGNNANPLDLGWLAFAIGQVHAHFPSSPVLAMTAGIANVVAIRDSGAVDGLSGIIYDYENNFANEPEFAFSFETTLGNLDAFHHALEGAGLESVVLVTGPPLMREWAAKWEWDYGLVGQRTDRTIIQSQTYCLTSADEFERAAVKAGTQFADADIGSTAWTPQVTVDPNSPNGVSPKQAAECNDRSSELGHKNLFLWWSPSFTDETVEFLSLIGR